MMSTIYVTGSAKTLHVRVFYTSSHKQLLSPDSATDFWFLCTKIKLGNFCTDTEISTIGQNLHANMEGFRRAGHIY